MKNDYQRRARSLSGFSLLELMVVVVLIAGFVAIVVPAIRSLGSLDLRNEITRLGALSNEVYALASMSGKTHRIIFDLNENNYWVEEKVGDAGEIKPELGYKELMKTRIEDAKKNEVERFLPSYKAVGGILGEKYQLPDDIVLYGAWTEQMPDVAREGQVAIYFFFDYIQSAFVSLAIKGEEEGSSLYFSLSPLTGAVEINQGEPNINDLRPSENKS